MRAVTGKNIAALRLKLKYSQEDIEDFLGINRASISYYENGTREVPIEHLTKLADLFGVELYDLMEDEEIAQKANTAFAFRANTIGAADMKTISEFKRIVKNYSRIVMLEKKHESKHIKNKSN